MCTYPVQPICTFSCTSVFFINIYYPQYIVLHILSHRTSYSFYCIICSLFHSHLYLYIYSLVLCFIVSLLMLFLFYFLFLFFLHFPLSGPVLTYISLLIIYTLYDCVCDKNKEPWTLNQWPAVCFFSCSFSAEFIHLHTNVNWDSYTSETRSSSMSAKLFWFDCSLKCDLYSAKGTPFHRTSAQTFYVSLEVRGKWHYLSEWSGLWIQSQKLERIKCN